MEHQNEELMSEEELARVCGGQTDWRSLAPFTIGDVPVVPFGFAALRGNSGATPSPVYVPPTNANDPRSFIFF